MTSSQQPSPPPPRFTLAGLFELIAGVGLVLALVMEFGGIGVAIVFIAVMVVLTARYLIVAPDRKAAWRDVNTIVGIGVSLALPTLCCWLLPAVGSREPSRHSRCSHHLGKIARALHEYHEVHGHFPPAYVPDANGKPMHSWRVLILPYLGYDSTYKAYNFNEPWNGPNNSKLAAEMPLEYRCPSAGSGSDTLTNYFYVVGPGRFDNGSKLKLSDFKDKETILLVESNNVEVHWMEPRDLTVDQMLRGANAKTPPSPSSNHFAEGTIYRKAGWFTVALSDASDWRIRNDVDAETLRALLTLDGGERVDREALRPAGDTSVRPEFYVLMSLTVAFVMLAIVRRVRLARRMRPGSA